jgi:multidrug efflux system outer membrane protein
MNSSSCSPLSGVAAVSAMLLLALQGCTTVGPDYQEPDIQTPDVWTEKVAEQVALGPQSSLQTWWKVLGDPLLDELIEQARKENLDLKVAASRVRQSRTILAIARGERQPLLNASATPTRSKLSDDGPLQEMAPASGFDPGNLFELKVDAVWEIDVFGRIRRTIEAAGAGYQASVLDYRDVLVTLFAEVALAYVDVRATQQRIVFARKNTRIQRGSLTLTLDSYESGVTSKLDVAQATGNLAVTESTIPSLEISLNQSINRLAVLLGRDAGSLQAQFSAIGRVPTPTEITGIGVPADALRQRPDIRAAERLLAAQTAQIGVATAALYPRFSLGGFFGLQSTSLSNLFDSSSETWSLSAPVQYSIFNGGQVRGNIRIQDEKAQQLLLLYRNKVLRAIAEVENAITALNRNQVRVDYLRTAAAATEEAVELVNIQYQTGLTDFNNVLVTQRDLSARQDQLVAGEAEVVVDLITLYKALGGGWDADEAISLSADQAQNPTP